MSVADPVATTCSAGITAEIAALRAHSITLHNSRLVCWFTMLMAACSVLIGVCMMLMVISVLTPLSAIGFLRILAALQWGLGGVAMCMMCSWLWKWCRRMLHNKVQLSPQGAGFLFGTPKKPEELFIAWEQITRVEQKRVNNVYEFTVLGSNGSCAQFSSYSFFRSVHVARMIAQRAGLTVQRT